MSSLVLENLSLVNQLLFGHERWQHGAPCGLVRNFLPAFEEGWLFRADEWELKGIPMRNSGSEGAPGIRVRWSVQVLLHAGSMVSCPEHECWKLGPSCSQLHDLAAHIPCHLGCAWSLLVVVGTAE